jgi:hypothetical protein
MRLNPLPNYFEVKEQPNETILTVAICLLFANHTMAQDYQFRL